MLDLQIMIEKFQLLFCPKLILRARETDIKGKVNSSVSENCTHIKNLRITESSLPLFYNGDNKARKVIRFAFHSELGPQLRVWMNLSSKLGGKGSHEKTDKRMTIYNSCKCLTESV